MSVRRARSRGQRACKWGHVACEWAWEFKQGSVLALHISAIVSLVLLFTPFGVIVSPVARLRLSFPRFCSKSRPRSSWLLPSYYYSSSLGLRKPVWRQLGPMHTARLARESCALGFSLYILHNLLDGRNLHLHRCWLRCVQVAPALHLRQLTRTSPDAASALTGCAGLQPDRWQAARGGSLLLRGPGGGRRASGQRRLVATCPSLP